MIQPTFTPFLYHCWQQSRVCILYDWHFLSTFASDMIKAMFFDVDGTLVSFNTHHIPESTIQALHEAHDRGVKIFTATGRPRQLLNNIREVEQIMDGYILATGALCTYGDHTVREDLIPFDEAHAVVDFCIERNLPAVVVGKKDIQIVNRNDLVNHVFYDMLKIDYDKFDVPVDDVIRQGILQITPFLTEDEERSILPDLPGCTSARWYPAFCDITSAAADKANGIRAIAQYMGLDISETMAFGDGGNDMSMLSAAGVGVAMGNALDKVKAEADYVTTSVDDDGIRNALLHFGVIDN